MIEWKKQKWSPEKIARLLWIGRCLRILDRLANSHMLGIYMDHNTSSNTMRSWSHNPTQ